MPRFHFTLCREDGEKNLCVLSVFCLNGQVSLGKAFDLLIANTEMLHFLPSF